MDRAVNVLPLFLLLLGCSEAPPQPDVVAPAAADPAPVAAEPTPAEAEATPEQPPVEADPVASDVPAEPGEEPPPPPDRDTPGKITISGKVVMHPDAEGELVLTVMPNRDDPSAEGSQMFPLAQPGQFSIEVEEAQGEVVVGVMVQPPKPAEGTKPVAPSFMSEHVTVDVGADPIEDLELIVVPADTVELKTP